MRDATGAPGVASDIVISSAEKNEIIDLAALSNTHAATSLAVAASDT